MIDIDDTPQCEECGCSTEPVFHAKYGNCVAWRCHEGHTFPAINRERIIRVEQWESACEKAGRYQNHRMDAD